MAQKENEQPRKAASEEWESPRLTKKDYELLQLRMEGIKKEVQEMMADFSTCFPLYVAVAPPVEGDESWTAIVAGEVSKKMATHLSVMGTQNREIGEMLLGATMGMISSMDRDKLPLVRNFYSEVKSVMDTHYNMKESEKDDGQ